MLAISTCWNSHRHSDGRIMLRELADLGFEAVEISHGTNANLFHSILTFLEHRKRKRWPVAICGLHNFCPAPVDVLIDAPDAFEFTSASAGERARAVKLTLETIDAAARLGAGYVVLHLGTARVRARTATLERLVKAGRLHSRDYVREKLALVVSRDEASSAALALVREALAEIVPHAEKLGVRLGIESRSHYEQIPNETEMRLLLDEFNASPIVGYWHDFGHVQRRANLGLADHAQWVKSMSDRLIGCHLHDAIWPDRDHQAPFHGSIDYATLVPLLPPDCPLVWEMNPRRRSEEIRASLETWKERFGAPPSRALRSDPDSP